MKLMKKPRSKWKAVLRFVMLVFCGFILGVNVYLANAKSLVGNQLPTPFGYGAAVVLSGSMEPEFSAGDLIVVREAENYQLNDIVVFQEENVLVVHRIIQTDGEMITTKGDANEAPDEPVAVTAVKGKVLFRIPYAGKVVGFLKTPVGTICMIVLAIVLIELPYRSEKKKDDEERQKILDEIQRLKNEE